MPGTTFRVLTFNTLWPVARKRLAAAAAILDPSGIDVVCLQEVAYRRNLALLERSLRSYPASASRPVGIWCTGGLVTFSRSPILHSSFEVYARRGDWLSIAAADRLLHKGFLTTRIHIGDLDVTVINTHLLANYDDDWSTRNRYVRHQEDELAQLSRAARAVDPASMLVVTGDFNVPAGHEMLARFVEESGLLNAYAPVSPPTFRGPASLAIDHVLYRAPAERQVNASAELMLAEPVTIGARTGFASDHIAVCASFDVA